MSRLTSRLSPARLLSFFVISWCFIFGSANVLQAKEAIKLASAEKTRTVVAEFLMVDGGLYIVRGERGEIQIEVTPATKLSDKFKFGDRIKAVLLPNDVAQSITRADPSEPLGTTINEVQEAAPPPLVAKKDEPKTEPASPARTTPSVHVPKVRVIVADLLMVDGSFYIVRTEYGEIQIEITSTTELSEKFQFGDKIKARVTPADKALSVVRAGKDEPIGIQDEAAPPVAATPALPVSPAPSSPSPIVENPKTPKATEEKALSTRIIVADVLMVDGDFYIVRGERGEIRIEVTPKTSISESFDYGDRIKAEVLPNDKALSIQRALPNDPVGITTP